MYYTTNFPNVDEMSVLDIIQFRTELPVEKCEKVRQELYQFFHCSQEEIDQLLRQFWNNSSMNVMTKLGEIAMHRYGAKSSIELALDRAHCMVKKEQEEAGIPHSCSYSGCKEEENDK